jgi:hypothetical protein
MDKKRQTKKLTETLKQKIRNDFVQGLDNEKGLKEMPSLEDLIKKYNVPKSTLYRVSNKENWKEQRKMFQDKYQEKLDNERIKNFQQVAKKIDSNSIAIAQTFLTNVGQALQKNMQDVQNGRQGMQPQQLNSLANVALTAQKIAKIALGESTENINVNAEVGNTETFRRAMELLDTVAEQRRTESNTALH